MEPIEIDVLLQAPIPIRMRWEDNTTELIDLPRLGTDDLIPWLDEITAERRDSFRKAIKTAGVMKQDLVQAEFAAEQNAKAVMTDLNAPSQRPAGIRRLLAMSLAMTTLPADKQASILGYLMRSSYTSLNLATRLSGLFWTGETRPTPPDPAEEAKKVFPGINQGGPANPLAVGGATPPTSEPA